MKYPNVLAKFDWATFTALAVNEAEIYIYGDIGEWCYDEDERKSITALKIVDKLNELGAVEYITVRINSHGGCVYDALAIYNALKRHPAVITVVIDGVALSAASMIAMCGDEVRMAANSIFMVHAPWTYASGNAVDIRKIADELDITANSMSFCYSRDGLDREAVLAMLLDGEDHSFGAEDAKEYGFVDAVVDGLEVAASSALARYPKMALPAAAAAIHNPERTNAMLKETQPKAAVTPAAVTPAAVTPAAVTPAAGIEAAQAEAQQKERDRLKARNAKLQGVFGAAAFASNEDVQAIYRKALSDPDITVDAAMADALTALGQESAAVAGTDQGIRMGQTQGDKTIEAASSALLARMGQGKHDMQNAYRGMRLHEMARDALARAGLSVNGMTAEEFAPMALAAGVVRGAQTTSDFPVILENALHKMVLVGYNAVSTTYDRFCKVGDVTDFRPWARLVPGLIGNLDSVNEHGEYKNKVLPDAEKQTIQASRKGNIISVTPEVLVNDDLGYIQSQSMDLGMAGPRTIERAVYALLEANPLMSDGVALFAAGHGNLAASGAAPTIALIDAASTAMAKQTAPGADAEILDIAPSVGITHRGLSGAMIEINGAEYNDDATKNQRKPNRVRGLLDDVIGTGRLTSTVAWYLFADPNQVPVIEVVFLNGQREPRIVQAESFETAGLKWRIELPFGVGAIGTRGAFKNPGE